MYDRIIIVPNKAGTIIILKEDYDDEGNPYEIIDGAEIMGGYATTRENIYIVTSYDKKGTTIMLPNER